MTKTATAAILAAQPIALTASGLSAHWQSIRRTIATSAACHPNWDTETHLGYLLWEEEIPAGIIRAMLGLRSEQALDMMVAAACREIRVEVAR